MLSVFLLASCNDFVDVVPKGKAIPTTVDDLGKLMNNSFISISGNNFGMVDVAFNPTEMELF